MGVIQGFDILFTNGKSVFTAKEHVSGEVVITLSEPAKVKSVELTLRGHAKVTKSGNLQKPEEKAKTKVGQTVNEYLNTKLQLTTGSSSTLPAGQTRLPFSFLLPEGLPTSFESRHARIRYWVEAVIIRTGWFKSKRRTLLGFTIIQHVDINQPELLTPVQGSKEHSIGCMCKKSFQANATLHRQGYCSGESILVELELVNGTKRPIQSQLTMIQQMEYKVKGRTHNDNQQINAMDLGVMAKSQRQQTSSYYMQVPPIAPSISSCNIITVGYVLQFSVGIVGSKEKVTFNCPFIVGTIPFRQSQPQASQPFNPQSDYNGFFTVDMPSPANWTGGGIINSGMPLDPPPSYPGGPEPRLSLSPSAPAAAPSAPPLAEYESRSGARGFLPSASMAAISLQDAPDLPEFNRCASESGINRMGSPSAPLSSHPRGSPLFPPVAPRPASPRTNRPVTGPARGQGRATDSPVRLTPVRAAPKGRPGQRHESAPLTPPPNVSPRTHVFEASGSSSVAHAYAECIFSNGGGGGATSGAGAGRGGGGGGSGDDWDDDDEDPDSYHYVPIYALAPPSLPPR